jgi:hypothetical protein
MRRRAIFLAGVTVVLAGLCIAAPPLYTIGSIPPQQVGQSATLTLQVKSSSAAPASFSYTLDPGYPAPLGAIALNSGSGIFTYAPAKADAFEFRVTFKSTVSGSTVDSQSVDIVPLPSLQPETDLIPDTAAIPDPASSDYLVVSQSLNTGQERFNGPQRTTRNIEISGKTVVFDGSAPQQYGNLYARFNSVGQSNADIKSLTIYAETATIRGPLSLPGTNVVIYARHLRFEDTAGKASINTTPLPYLTGAAQFADGLPGQSGGNITLHIGDFYSDPGTSIRLISQGGTGQDAGQGRAGNAKPPLANDPGYRQLPVGSSIVISAPSDPIAYSVNPKTGAASRSAGSLVQPKPPPVYEESYTCSTPEVPYPKTLRSFVPGCSPPGRTWGSKTWPADGENAVSPGKPGNGGQGGQLASNLIEVRGSWTSQGNNSGALGNIQLGGPPQEPTLSAWVKHYAISATKFEFDHTASSGHIARFAFDDYWFVTAQHTSVKGKDAPPRPADIPVGGAGSFASLSGQSAQWLHPYALRQVIAQAKDAYRGGNHAYGWSCLADYLDVFSKYGTPPGAFALTFQQAQQETQELLYRINSKVDYFGHGVGWVPLLSLQAQLQAFQSEVDAAVPEIYLGEYVQSKALRNQKDLSALEDTLSSLTSEVKQNASDVNTALKSVPGLQHQAQLVVVQTQTVQSAIQAREAQLIQKAKDDVDARNSKPAWEKALKVLGTVASAASVVYPPLALVGTGLNLIASVDSNTPWQDISAATDLAKQIAGSDLRDVSGGIADALSTVTDSIDDFTSESAIKEAADLGAAAQKVSSFINTSSKTVAGSSISDSAVNQEYQSLLAQDPTFKDLTAQLTTLMAQKTALAQALQQTMQTISTGTSTIGNDLSSIASVEQSVNTTATQIDHGMVVYVKEMERGAKERLLRYQYYMAKAYEYRMLQPYPGNLNIQSVVDKVLAVMATDGYPASPTNLAAIKSVYTNSVRQIIFAALNQLQTQPPERSLPFLFNLTSDQLNTLNQSGQLTLDLAPLIAGLPNEDNRHIADLSVANISVQTTGALGPVARVRLVVNHQGQSIETLAGHQYQFYFGNSRSDQPFTWGASYNLPNGPLSQEQLSVSGLSLLQSLLGITSTTDPFTQALVLFARPGADAVVSISKVQDPANLGAQITSLQMSATVDFFRTASNLVKLSVQTANGNLPYIKVDRPDVTGRADGLGTFRRNYHVGDPVTLQAEPEYGVLKFVKYIDGAGNVLGTSTTLPLTLTSSPTVQPVYSVPAPTAYTIAGRVVDGTGTGIAGVSLVLGGAKSAIVATAADGTYQFGGLPVGDYAVTPALTGYTFTPPAQSFAAIAGNQAANFTAQAVAPSQYSISGRVVDGAGNGVAAVTVSLSGNRTATATGGATGGYQFTGLLAGNYTVTPAKTGYTFTPPSQSLTALGSNQTANFTAQGLVPPSQYTISGRVVDSGGKGLDGAILTLAGAKSATAISGPDGGYQFPGLLAGDYTVTAAESGHAFVPQSSTFNGLAVDRAANFTATSVPLRFVRVTPCRVADTRLAAGPFGAPALATNTARIFAIPAGPCGIPANASAYSLNLTVVPLGPLGFISIWPAGQSQPVVSTLNSVDGRVKANAVIVPAGANGAITVFATNPTHAIIDINGYFVPAAGVQNLAFYPVTPCRVADTRLATGTFGGPALAPLVTRDIPVSASLCGIPATAQAYALNMTVVPSSGLGFLATWPAGAPRPLVSTLNDTTGTIVANAAIVPAGVNGAITVFATDTTHLIIDISGYFAPPGAAGSLDFFTATPCRIVDTRLGEGEHGGPVMGAGQKRSFLVPSSACSIPATAKAYSLNATVVPTTSLGFLTLWGSGVLPLASTLNALDGTIVANAAIVPAGASGAVTAFTTHQSHLILDINGYFQ